MAHSYERSVIYHIKISERHTRIELGPFARKSPFCKSTEQKICRKPLENDCVYFMGDYDSQRTWNTPGNVRYLPNPKICRQISCKNSNWMILLRFHRAKQKWSHFIFISHPLWFRVYQWCLCSDCLAWTRQKNSASSISVRMIFLNEKIRTYKTK